MNEKITITGSLQKGLTKKGNPYFTLTLADGRRATCFDQQLAQTLNQEIEVEIKQSEYNGVTEYIVNPLGGANGLKGGGFNLPFNQRRVALESAAASMAGGVSDGAAILKRADAFYAWMKGDQS